VRVALADKVESSLLGVAPGAPILEIRRIAYSYHQVPVEVRISHVNTEHYEYVGASASHDEPL
jgi:GntR family transcriptional regulator